MRGRDRRPCGLELLLRRLLHRLRLCTLGLDSRRHLFRHLAFYLRVLLLGGQQLSRAPPTRRRTELCRRRVPYDRLVLLLLLLLPT